MFAGVLSVMFMLGLSAAGLGCALTVTDLSHSAACLSFSAVFLCFGLARGRTCGHRHYRGRKYRQQKNCDSSSAPRCAAQRVPPYF
jgi:hypothetical protein